MEPSKLLKRFAFVSFFILLFAACSTESSSLDNETLLEQQLDAEKLTAPNGQEIAESMKALAEKISTDNIEILNINFVKTPENYNGIIAEVSYKTNGVIEHIILLRNFVEINYSSGISVKVLSSNQKVAQKDIKVSCTGSGCCKPGGSYNFETGVFSFDCSCEGNPEGNSDCTMHVTEV